jgi:hypothetical protein
MIRQIAMLTMTALAMLTGCVKENPCDLCDELRELERRVTDLEDAVRRLEDFMKKGVLIESVTEIEGGWRITFTGGEPRSIDIMHGTPAGDPPPGKAPRLEVRRNPDGTATLWVDYGDGKGWQDTETDLTGPRGSSGSGWAGKDGVAPKIKVVKNSDNTVTVWYNVTEGYPESGWVNTGYDLSSSSSGPVAAIADNLDGTVTITLSDGKAYTFEKASTAVRFEILEYERVEMAGGEKGTVRFAVNPSTAWVPTGEGDDIDRWHLNAVGTRAPGYVVESTAFSITGIEQGGAKGEYVATVACAEGSYEGWRNDEHIVSLVLDTSATTDAAPVLVTSGTFPLFVGTGLPVAFRTRMVGISMDMFDVDFEEPLTFYWGDDSDPQLVKPCEWHNRVHDYLQPGEKRISIVGNTNSIGSISFYNHGMTMIDVGGYTGLRTLTLYGNQVMELNVSGCVALGFVHCSYEPIDMVDLGDLPQLMSVTFVYGMLESLDIGDCPELRDVTLYNNKLSKEAIEAIFGDLPDVSGLGGGTIDVSGNPGTAEADATIATAKGWAVTTTP